VSTQTNTSANAIDVQAATAALRRAAALARKTAIDTDTHLVVMENGHIVHIPAARLREQHALEQASAPVQQRPEN